MTDGQSETCRDMVERGNVLVETPTVSQLYQDLQDLRQRQIDQERKHAIDIANWRARYSRLAEANQALHSKYVRDMERMHEVLTNQRKQIVFLRQLKVVT